MIFADLKALLEYHNKLEHFEAVYERSPEEYMAEYGYSTELIQCIVNDLQIKTTVTTTANHTITAK